MTLYMHHADVIVNNQDLKQVFFSSSASASYINWKIDGDLLKHGVNTLIKTVSSSQRVFDPTYKYWIIYPDLYDRLCKLFVLDSRIIFHDDLVTFIEGKEVIQPKRAPRPEDFFKNNGPVAKPVASLQDIEKALEQYLKPFPTDLTIKKRYLKACMLYHPDRNNGDASKMTELNSLYTQYKQLIGTGA